MRNRHIHHSGVKMDCKICYFSFAPFIVSTLIFYEALVSRKKIKSFGKLRNHFCKHLSIHDILFCIIFILYTLKMSGSRRKNKRNKLKIICSKFERVENFARFSFCCIPRCTFHWKRMNCINTLTAEGNICNINRSYTVHNMHISFTGVELNILSSLLRLRRLHSLKIELQTI